MQMRIMNFTLSNKNTSFSFTIFYKMKKTLLISLIALLLASCKNNGNGELVGVAGRRSFYQPDPYGMVSIPTGSYTMGVGDEDIEYSHLNPARTITISPFFMDETEITNNEYRQFVFWVRDSITRKLLGQMKPEFLIKNNKKTGEVYDQPVINWDTKINGKDPNLKKSLEPMYLPKNERYFGKKEIDTRKLFYEYYFVDLIAAAKKSYTGAYESKYAGFANRPQGMKDRSVYVHKDVINVYPDTLCWLHDYAYSYNEPIAQRYFWHPSYDNYPVVGVNWKQATAFCIWRTRLYESHITSKRIAMPSEFRLPSEAEWEWAAKGGNSLSAYPWGGPYTTTDKGCYLANFKPLRGNYTVDGFARTAIVGHYPANDFGLYDMAGNVAEWCADAWDESASQFTWDMNPGYQFNAKESDKPNFKRKVIRGGSWKDIAYYIRTSTRSYEYQDSAKSYIGFRCVQDVMGQHKKESKSGKSSRVYN